MLKSKAVKTAVILALLILTGSKVVYARASFISEGIVKQSGVQIIQTDKDVKPSDSTLIIEAVTEVTKPEQPSEGVAVIPEAAVKPKEIKEKKQIETVKEKSAEEVKVEVLSETSLDSISLWTLQKLNLRTGAGTEHTLILTIPAAEKVQGVSKVSNGWFKVQYEDKVGYVSGKYLGDKAPDEPKSVQSSNKNMTIRFPDSVVPYKNGGQANGQSIIDRNNQVASTWGGAATFSGSDGRNTHFIAHNPGAFKNLWNYSIGARITITDHNGISTVYSIVDKFIVDDNGTRQDSGENYYNFITSTRGGEVITLQTCKSSELNYIVRAVKVN